MKCYINTIPIEILIIIFKKVSINLSSVCKDYRYYYNYYNLDKKSYVFESLNILIWAYNINYKFNDSSVLYASMNNNFDILKWLHTNNCKGFNEVVFANTTYHGNLDAMQWLYDIKCPWDVNTFDSAFCNRNLNDKNWYKIVFWLKNNNCPWHENTFSRAVLLNCFDMVVWLKDNKCPWNYYTFANAAKIGNFTIMNYLKKYKCPLNSFVFECAAQHNNLKSMKWLYKNGCSWNYTLYEYAIINNNIKMLEWLKENNCIWEKSIFQTAIDYNNLNMMIWFDNNNFGWKDNHTINKAINSINNYCIREKLDKISDIHYNILEWLYNKKCKLAGYFTYNSNKAVINWLREKDCNIIISMTTRILFYTHSNNYFNSYNLYKNEFYKYITKKNNIILIRYSKNNNDDDKEYLNYVFNYFIKYL